MLCVPIKGPDFNALIQANLEADLVELHCDNFTLEELKKARKALQKPVIFKLTSLNEALLKLNPDYIDLPHTTKPYEFDYIATCYPKIKRICSYHHFHETPPLQSIWKEMQLRQAEVYKICTFAKTSSDALRMLKFMRSQGVLGICMGPRGLPTRILAPIFKAPWTYAPLAREHQTAEGQLLLQELVGLYRFRELSHQTKIFGLIGHPVSQSVSHRTHNIAFGQLGLDAIYVKMEVEEEELSQFLSLCRELGFCGLSVTMPLKKAVLPFLDTYEEEAINTLHFIQGRIRGYNTDGSGALDALEKRGAVSGKHIALIGAGGVACGIAQEAKRRGARLSLLNRTFSKAQALAQRVGGKAFPLESFSEIDYDILINCTSNNPIPKEEIKERTLVMDVVYTPEITPFLKGALKRQCPIVTGGEMFVQQAVGQFSRWFKEHLIHV